ncbi:HYR-like domain-containing protein, partial [Draconibacterium sediminis]
TLAYLTANGLTITDACGTDNLVVTSSDAEPTGECPWTIIRTYTVTDACGNETTAQQTITVDDTQAPAITGTLTAINDEGCSPADATPATNTLAYLTANGLTITDACGTDNLVVTSSDAEPTGECPWTIIRTYTVTDACGNETTAQQTITVDDTQAPIIDNTNLTNINVECGIDPANKLSDWLANHAGATATDNCGDVTWSHNYGENENVQCDGGAITVTFTATDACGNISTTSASYSIQDNTAPTFNETLPTAEITAECDGVVEAVMLTASDNCDTEVPVVFTETRTDGDCANSYTLTRTWTATDDCGNETSFTQTVTVSDNTAPTFNETLPTAE